MTGDMIAPAAMMTSRLALTVKVDPLASMNSIPVAEGLEPSERMTRPTLALVRTVGSSSVV